MRLKYVLSGVAVGLWRNVTMTIAMVLTTAMHEHPWATPFLLISLGVAFAAIFGKVQGMVFGETTAQRLPHAPAALPVFAHLAIVLLLGLYIPPYLAQWYRQAAQMIG